MKKTALQDFGKLDLDFQFETICGVEPAVKDRPDGEDDYTGLTIMTTYLV
jgi:hypothetical protein